MPLEPDLALHFDAWKSGPSPATTGRLLKAVHPIIDTALRSYGGGSVASPTLRSKAKQMAIGAFGTYDPERGTLKTHLLSQLQGLRRSATREQNIISRPEQVGLDYHHLQQSENELRDWYGREPSDLEVADHTGLSLKRIGHIRRSNLPLAEGQTLRPDAEGNSNVPASSRPDQVTQDADAWHSFVYHDLGATDQVIMDHTLGRNGRPKLSSSQIAQRLGITVGAVSQRTAKIQKLLDQRQELDLL